MKYSMPNIPYSIDFSHHLVFEIFLSSLETQFSSERRTDLSATSAAAIVCSFQMNF